MLAFLAVFTVLSGYFSFTKITIPQLKNISYKVPHENYVYLLNETHFDSIVRIQPIMLVQLYINNDIMHQYMDLDYEEAAKISAKSIKVPFGMIELSHGSKLMDEFMFSDGFQLIVFKNSIPFIYIGPEDSKGIVEQLKKYSDPEWIPTRDDTVKLTPDKIDSFIGENLSFIFVYDDDMRSERLLTMFKLASVQLKHFYGIKVGLINGKKYPEIQSLLDIESIPEALHCIHKKCYKNMKHVMYIQDFIGLAIGSMHGGRKINTKEDFFKRSHSHWIRHEPTYLAMIESDDSTEMRVLEHSVYAFHNTHSIYYSLDSNLKLYFNCTARECFRVCYPPFLMLPGDEEDIEAKMLKNDDLKNFSMMARYINENTLPLVAYRYHYNYRLHYYYSHRLPLLIVYGPYSYNDTYYEHYDEANKEAHNMRMQLLPLALKYRKLQFCVSHSELLAHSIANEMLTNKPVVTIYDEDGYTYVMDPKLEASHDNIDRFAFDYLAGELIPHDNSDELPMLQYEEGILVLVTKNFLKEARKRGRDMFLILYHGSTHHMMYEKTELHRLVDKLHQNTGIVLAKMRYDSNLLPRSFKSDNAALHYLIKDGDYKHPMEYTDKFEAMPIIKFLEKHSTYMHSGWPNHIQEEL